MPEGPEWDHYCDHLQPVECTDASGRDYMGITLRSWRNCESSDCYLCNDDVTGDEWRKSDDGEYYYAQHLKGQAIIADTSAYYDTEEE